MTTPSVACKILPKTDWDTWCSTGRFLGAGIDIQSHFIHLAAESQAEEILRLFFSGARNLVVVTIDLSRLGSTVRWETAPEMPDVLFPHCYGEIPMSAVISHRFIAEVPK
ncbi:hypothetical protein PAPYR_3899 [Paratrimastix pyriformis]|uniref:Uncharacterized protein n=1 Tax=Paratrimastix pyriformis TaxID=342808 RepID=A0ABQ8UKW7_9EUKA|nr:hypothetical protein PAPYR_3899 [Paratrimastix pyriformis]